MIRVSQEEVGIRRGQLTVFLGSASGVGKTRAMILAAREKQRLGRRVVLGCLEQDYVRRWGDAAVDLPTIAQKRHFHNGHIGVELDAEAILLHRPDLVLVDGLATPNPLGSLHPRRYMDVDDLLSAGIDVYTTLNIHEVESLRDIVAQVAGIQVDQAVPDSFLDRGAHFQLVDLPTDELIEFCLKRNDVVQTDAMRRFYRPGNISAFRELAMRYVASHVDRDLEHYMAFQDIKGPWPVAEKLMVCVSASPFSERLIRIGRQMAASLKSDWMAVHVETPRSFRAEPGLADTLTRNLALAEELGAEVVSISGHDVARELLDLAQHRNVLQIVIGKPSRIPFWDWLRPSVVNRVVQEAEGISVHLIPGRPGRALNVKPLRLQPRSSSSSYTIATLLVAILTLALQLLAIKTGLVNIALVYLLPVLVCAVRYGFGPAIYASVIGVLSFDFFFVPPVLSFSVSDLRYLVSFAVFLAVAVLTASLSARLRLQLFRSNQRERSNAALYGLSRQMTAASDLESIYNGLVRHANDTFSVPVVLFLQDESSTRLRLAKQSDPSSAFGSSDADLALATWAFTHVETAGRGTHTLRESAGLCLPLKADHEIQGILAIYFDDSDSSLMPERIRLAEALVDVASMAIVRIKLEEEAKVAHLTAESERLRTALLDSISHELRTPLTAIIGSVTGMIESGEKFSLGDQRELLLTIRDGAMRMNRLVVNLLGMVRLESGMLRLRKEWCDMADIVGVALKQVKDALQNRRIQVQIAEDLPMIPADDVLVEQVLVNVLSNAIKYSVDGSQIGLNVCYADQSICVSVSDAGIGIAEDELPHVFDKFYRARRARRVPGTGLGLAICKGIVEAHGGTIAIKNARPQGVEVTIRLPACTRHDIVIEEGDSEDV